jgi:hypothetical protein
MTHKKYLLLNWVFIVGLALLLLNDHYWKWTYGNYLTGKLSDFAGLLILPLLLAYFLPKPQQKWAVYLSGLFFLFWKSPCSESFIEAYNQLALIPISRVVDYSDLMALAILPFAGLLIRRLGDLPFLCLKWKLLTAPVLVTFTVFSFVATSPPPSFYYNYNYQQGNVQFYHADYNIKMSKTAIVNKLGELGLQVKVDSTLMKINPRSSWSYSDTLDYTEAPYYLISEMVVEEDTLKNIQFGLRQLSDSKTRFYLNALTTSSVVDSIQVEQQLSRLYEKFLKKALIRALRRD